MKKRNTNPKKRVRVAESEVNEWKQFFTEYGVKAEFVRQTPKMTYVTIESVLLKGRATVGTVTKIRDFIKNYEPATI